MQNFQIPLPGNAILTCTVEERWEVVLLSDLRCGQKFQREITRRIGVRHEQRENLEAAVKGSLGMTGIAQLESTIKAISGPQVSFEQVNEVKDTRAVEADKCGHYMLLVYQLKQLFHFEYCSPRWFGHDRWTLTVEQWLDRYRDDSRQCKNDPACGCSPESDLGFDGRLPLSIKDGKFDFVIGFKLANEKVTFPDLNLTADSNLGQLCASRATIPTNVLPEYSRFLAALEEQSADVVFSLLPIPNLSAADLIVTPPAYLPGQFVLPSTVPTTRGYIPGVHQSMVPPGVPLTFPYNRPPSPAAYAYGPPWSPAFSGYVRSLDIAYWSSSAYGVNIAELPMISLHHTT